MLKEKIVMSGQRVFVTVGTTKFDKLIKTVSNREILDVLQKLGYNTIQFQTGIGSYTEETHETLSLCYDKYFEDFDGEIDKADLIISHAGAGTCIQVLKKKKPLVVVVNDDLMDNHQTELAEELQERNLLYYCTCDTLKQTLLRDMSKLKSYEITELNGFSNYLNKCMGFMY